MDAVCYAYEANSAMPFSSDGTYTCEGTPVLNNPHNNGISTNVDASIQRKPGGSAGSCIDTQDNGANFATLTPADPQSSVSALTP